MTKKKNLGLYNENFRLCTGFDKRAKSETTN